MLISLIPVKCLHVGSDELELGTGVQTLDALVHFAAVPRILIKLDNEELVAQIEGKVGSDLQYIRLNGAVVGGLVGIIIASIKLLLN